MRPEKGPTPKISIERRKNSRVFFVEEGDEEVGRACLNYYSKPFPLYEVINLDVEDAHQNKGYGSAIMGAVEKHLKKIGRAGVLAEAIDSRSPASGMYERRGWTRVSPDSNRHAFNLPKGVPKERIAQFYNRINERDGRTQLAWVKKLNPRRED